MKSRLQISKDELDADWSQMQIELALADTAYSNGKVDVFALSVEIIWRELQLTQAIEGMHENMSDQALHVKIGT